MCWQGIDWAVVGSYMVWFFTMIVYIGFKIYKNKTRLKKDITYLCNGVTDIHDAEAVFDLLLFVIECITTLGGTRNVRGILEDAVKRNGDNGESYD